MFTLYSHSSYLLLRKKRTKILFFVSDVPIIVVIQFANTRYKETLYIKIRRETNDDTKKDTRERDSKDFYYNKKKRIFDSR